MCSMLPPQRRYFFPEKNSNHQSLQWFECVTELWTSAALPISKQIARPFLHSSHLYLENIMPEYRVKHIPASKVTTASMSSTMSCMWYWTLNERRSSNFQQICALFFQFKPSVRGEHYLRIFRQSDSRFQSYKSVNGSPCHGDFLLLWHCVQRVHRTQCTKPCICHTGVYLRNLRRKWSIFSIRLSCIHYNQYGFTFI